MTRRAYIESILSRHKIKDYAKVHLVFTLYLEERYDTMSQEIYFYGDFDLFRDLVSFLQDSTSSKHAHFYFMDIVDQYLARIDAVWEETKIRRERKKYQKYW